jgi:hypothetical protein
MRWLDLEATPMIDRTAAKMSTGDESGRLVLLPVSSS